MANPKPGSKMFGFQSAERYERLQRNKGVPTTPESPSVGARKSKRIQIPSTLVDRLDQETKLGMKRKN